MTNRQEENQYLIIMAAKVIGIYNNKYRDVYDTPLVIGTHAHDIQDKEHVEVNKTYYNCSDISLLGILARIKNKITYTPIYGDRMEFTTDTSPDAIARAIAKSIKGDVK